MGAMTHAANFGFDGRGEHSSFASNEPLTLGGITNSNSPKMHSRLHQRTQEVSYYHGMPISNVEEEALRESRLTNIVLDDFRKHVSNLEQQVDRQSSSALGHTLNQSMLPNGG